MSDDAHWSGYAVHVYTASGIIPAFFAAVEIASPVTDPRWVFFYLLITLAIDATDGPLARRFHVKHTAAKIDGRTIDDLLDYLTFAFLPLLLVWRMDWLPAGTGWTVSLAMGASLFGFANRDAKDEANGFFRGFPSYWNIYAFYAGLMTALWGPWPAAVLLWFLTLATVAPLWLIYPNLAPQPLRTWLLVGAAIWTLIVVVILPSYPQVSPFWFWLSLLYPAFYTAASFYQARRVRRS